MSFNLDGPANTTAQMQWSGDKNIIADDAWHLYEWTIDSTTWGQSQVSVARPHNAATGSHTIDSIYIRSPSVSRAANSTWDFYVDFVAKTDADSISVATLVPVIPEPSSVSAGLLGGFGMWPFGSAAAWLDRRIL